VLKGRRELSDHLAEKMGYERVTRFIRRGQKE
jgi:hypothetical protein